MVECSFGILASKWRILHKSIETSVENATLITKTTCVLHNLVLTHEKDSTSRDFQNTDLLKPALSKCNNSYTKQSKDIRNTFSAYFNSPLGEVPWQWNVI